MRKFRHMVLGAVACSLVVAAPARAGCWGGGEVAASKVRALQTMLMVAALKCKASGIDISAPYNAFVVARRDALDAANGSVRRHYAEAGAGQVDYDRFATVLANAYSAEAKTSAKSCGEAAQLAVDAADGAADLIRVSEQRVTALPLPDGACEQPATSVAATAKAGPVEQPAKSATLLASAQPASAAASTIPPEVAAAMAIVAAYARDHGAAPAVAPETATAMAATLP